MLRSLKRPLTAVVFAAACLAPAVAQAQASLVAAVLPASRSTQVGTTATAFATLINAGSDAASGCTIAPGTVVASDFFFQTTDPADNTLTGSRDAAVDIAAGESQSFLIAFTPTAAFAPTEVALTFDCGNREPATSTTGLNTLLLSASVDPVPDIVALAATTSNDGIVTLDAASAAAAFAVATVNVGTAGTITASADTGAAILPATLTVCQTDPISGACLAAPAASVTTPIAAGATPTFGIFISGSGAIAFDPAANRVFARFRDQAGVIRGATSVALRSAAAAPFALTSSAFAEGQRVPTAFTCDASADAPSPPLAWSGVPSAAQSLALIMDDPDAPGGTFTHWLLYRLPATTTSLAQGVPRQGVLADGSRQGVNSGGGIGYFPPSPPGTETHRYIFRLLALDIQLDLAAGADSTAVANAVAGRILAEARLTGMFR